jgi:plasmid segregation protein ParM
MGVNQCVIAASNAVMDKLGVKIDDAIIQQTIRYGKADIAKEYFAVLKTAITQYANSIFDMLRRYEYNPKLMRLYITGGGGKLIENFGRYEHDRVTIIGDICASAKGYEQFALMIYRKGGKA